MQEIEEMRGARIIVDTCAGVGPDESVVIVTDWLSTHIARRIAAAVRTTGATLTVVAMDPQDHDGNEPNEVVNVAMQAADVIIPTLDRSITHTAAMDRACDDETRWITVRKFTPDELVDGALFADFEAARAPAQTMTDRLTAAETARVTSPQGTDVTFDLAGRGGNLIDSTATEPGSITGAGSVEANISPVEGTAEGTFVADGAIPSLDIGALEEPVTFEIEDGAVTSVEGGRPAERIRRAWNEYDVPAVYNVAQLAVGMNPAVREFSDRFIAAHGRYGNVHIGIGTSEGLLGGEVRAPVHFDAMMGEPTLELDGEVFLKDGSEFHL